MHRAFAIHAPADVVRSNGIWPNLAALAGAVCVVAGATCAPVTPDDVIIGREDIDAGADADADSDAGGHDDAGTVDDAGVVVDAGAGDDAGVIVDAGEQDDAGVVVTEPDFASLPWEMGDDVGFGVARKDTGNPRGDSAAVIYGGYGASLDLACAWAGALYDATLRARGVRSVYCVQGPSTV